MNLPTPVEERIKIVKLRRHLDVVPTQMTDSKKA